MAHDPFSLLCLFLITFGLKWGEMVIKNSKY